MKPSKPLERSLRPLMPVGSPEGTLERVGLILKSGTILELKNISPDPANSFSVDPTDLIQYEEQAVASWHTHPRTPCDLSGADLEGFLNWPQLLHIIIGTDGVAGYVIERGAVLNDAGKDHPAWSLEGHLAD